MLNNQVLVERHSMVVSTQQRQYCAQESSCPFSFRLLNFRFHMRLIYHKSIHSFSLQRRSGGRNITLYDISSTPLLSVKAQRRNKFCPSSFIKLSSLAYSLLNFMSMSVCFFLSIFNGVDVVSEGNGWSIDNKFLLAVYRGAKKNSA